MHMRACINSSQRFLFTLKMAFRSPPERLLRPLANAISAKTRHAIGSEINRTSTRMYRAAVCRELGKPLAVEEMPAPQLAESQVRVAVHSCGINFADVLICMGKYQEKPKLPFVPGNEIAGEVIEVGEKVKTISKGDRVMGLMPAMNGLAEEVVVSQESLWQIPPSLSFKEAAAVAISYGTAYVGLAHRARIKPGQTVLVTAAAGALGLATVDLAANVFGAKVIGAASSEKLDIVKKIGAVATVDYNKESIKDKVKELTGGRGANIIMDAVGGDVFKECLRCIAWDGTIIPAGFASGNIPQIPANIVLVKNCNVAGLYWGAHGKFNPPLLKESLDKSIEFIQQGKLKGPHVCTTFDLDKVNDAFKFLLQRKSTGKVVVNTR